MQVPTLPSLLASASRTIRRSSPDLSASIRGEWEGTTGGQFGLDELIARGRNVLQLHITHFMTANSLYTDAYNKLIVDCSLFFCTHLECEPIYFSDLESAKVVQSRRFTGSPQREVNGPSTNFICSIPVDVSLNARPTPSESENTHCSTTKAYSLAERSLHGGRTRSKHIIAANQRTILFSLVIMLGRHVGKEATSQMAYGLGDGGEK